MTALAAVAATVPPRSQQAADQPQVNQVGLEASTTSPELALSAMTSGNVKR